jgi:hypothetical protein
MTLSQHDHAAPAQAPTSGLCVILSTGWSLLGTIAALIAEIAGPSKTSKG